MYSGLDNPKRETLSARQAEIARMVAQGKSSREIADALGLSPRTLHTHVTAIFNKLGVRSRLELVATLLRPGRIEPGHATVSPLRSVNAIPKNLPRKLTSFIGREAEIAEISFPQRWMRRIRSALRSESAPAPYKPPK